MRLFLWLLCLVLVAVVGLGVHLALEQQRQMGSYSATAATSLPREQLRSPTTKTQGDNPFAEPRRPFRFSPSKLFELTAMAALWCSAGIARDNVTRGMAYAVVTAIATWIIIGRWAVKLTPKAGRLVFGRHHSAAGGRRRRSDGVGG